MLRRGIRVALMASVAAIGLAPQSKADLIVNGGFETGDLTGWTVGAFDSGASVAASPIAPRTGNFDLQFISAQNSPFPADTSSPNVEISQTFTTTPGMAYAIVLYATSTSSQSAEITVGWTDSAHNGTVDTHDVTPNAWGLQGGGFVADSSTTTLSIGLFAGNGVGIAIDDVSVFPVTAPEPSTALPAIAAGVLCLWRKRRCAARKTAHRG